MGFRPQISGLFSASVMGLAGLAGLFSGSVSGLPGQAWAQAAVDAGPAAEAPARPAVLEPVPVRLELADGGALDLDGGVPTDAPLRVVLEPRLEDARVRVLDGSGKQLPAKEELRLTQRTEVTISPDPALKTGTEYRLVVEPDLNEPIRDPKGRAYGPAEVRFRTAGEPPPKSAKSKAKSNKRRRKKG